MESMEQILFRNLGFKKAFEWDFEGEYEVIVNEQMSNVHGVIELLGEICSYFEGKTVEWFFDQDGSQYCFREKS